MKKTLIVSLVCVNVVLLLALIVLNTDRAEAQSLRGGNDYLVVTGRIEATVDAVYVLDMKTRRLAAWRFDPNTKRLRPYKGRLMTADFGAAKTK